MPTPKSTRSVNPTINKTNDGHNRYNGGINYVTPDVTIGGAFLAEFMGAFSSCVSVGGEQVGACHNILTSEHGGKKTGTQALNFSTTTPTTLPQAPSF